jgi:hypothetical protein
MSQDAPPPFRARVLPPDQHRHPRSRLRERQQAPRAINELRWRGERAVTSQWPYPHCQSLCGVAELLVSPGGQRPFAGRYPVRREGPQDRPPSEPRKRKERAANLPALSASSISPAHEQRSAKLRESSNSCDPRSDQRLRGGAWPGDTAVHYRELDRSPLK